MKQTRGRTTNKQGSKWPVGDGEQAGEQVGDGGQVGDEVLFTLFAVDSSASSPP